MESSRPVSERGGGSRNSSIFGSAHTVNRRLLASPGCGISPASAADMENDLEVEDYGSVGSDLELSESDYDYDDEEEEYIDQPDEPDNDQKTVALRKNHTGGPATVDDDDDVDSEEERAIVAQIKEEIKNQVRGEMKEELDLYINPPSGGEKAKTDEDPSLDDLEPKLREAILKMRKFDRILERKVKREMEVKRERLRLQKRLRQELEDLKNNSQGKQPRKEELVNTEKFLALAPPPKHNEGVEDVSPPVTPVFTTQLPDSEFADRTGNKSSVESEKSTKGKENAGHRTSRSRSDGATSTNSGTTAGASTSLGGKMSGSSTSMSGKSVGKKKKKDFIKRNIELAGDAANMIAMTDDEKCRLDLLLKDISNLPDIPEGGEFYTQAFEVAVVSGEGYSADQDQKHQLSRIEDRLSVLAPDRDYGAGSVASSELDALRHCQYLSRGLRSSADWDQLGEPSLQETKEEREMRTKLETVERQLEMLSAHADLEVPTPAHLSEDTLSLLLGEYAQCLSRTTRSQSTNTDQYQDGDDESEVPAVACIYENVPHLDQDTLNKLLREARSGMSFNQLENESDDTKALKMGNVTDRTLESHDQSGRHSSRLSRRSCDDPGRPSPAPSRSSPASSRRPETPTNDARPNNEPRVLLPEIHASYLVAAGSHHHHDTRSRRANNDNFIHNSLDLVSARSAHAVSPPVSAPPRRPPSKPRNLAPISTHLELHLSDDENN